MAGARERRNGIEFGGDLLSGVEGVAKSSVRRGAAANLSACERGSADGREGVEGWTEGGST
jgi:hypothetical protein